MRGEWVEAFLYVFERTGNVDLSAQRAGVSRQQVYRRRGRDSELKKRMREIKAAREGRRLDRVTREFRNR